MAKKKFATIQKFSERLTEWIGSPISIILHTMFFIAVYALIFFGWSFEEILTFLTNVVSIEAIYLALFIQMTVNKTSEDIEDVEEDIDDIEKDIDDIQEDEKKDDKYDREVAITLKKINDRLDSLQQNLEELKKKL